MISLHKRIAAVLALFLVVVLVASAYVSLRTACMQEQAFLSEHTNDALELAADSAGDDETLRALAKLMDLRITRMDHEGLVGFDSDGVYGFYLDQEEVSLARKEGYGLSLQSNMLSGQVEVRACKALDDGQYIRVVCQRAMFSHSAWGAYFVWMVVLLALSIAFAVFYAYMSLRPLAYATRIAQSIGNSGMVISPKTYAYAEVNQLLSTLQTMNNHLLDTVEELKRRSAEMDSIIASMNNGLIAVDGQMRVVRMNQAARKMLGVQGKVEGRLLLEATGNARLEASLKEAMEKDQLTQVELPVRTDLREEDAVRHKLIRAYISGLEHDGGAIGAVALMEDITQLRHLEQMRIDFAANVTHELKTPLTSIKGFIETLQQGAIDDKEMARKFLNIIAEEADRLYRLINDVLSLSSMEAGRVRAPTARLSLGQAAQEACLFLKKAAEDKQIDLQVEEDGDGFIQANNDHVKQLLINLIDNAIKYTLNGGKVWVRVQREADQVVLRVKDTGIGIAQEHIPRLFERFYRVDKGRSRNMGGTGLGLAIVKHIVMDMGGDISVESELGVGTEFIVRLPYDRGNQA